MSSTGLCSSTDSHIRSYTMTQILLSTAAGDSRCRCETCVAPMALGGNLYITDPILTEWANFRRASGAEARKSRGLRHVSRLWRLGNLYITDPLLTEWANFRRAYGACWNLCITDPLLTGGLTSAAPRRRSRDAEIAPPALNPENRAASGMCRAYGACWIFMYHLTHSLRSGLTSAAPPALNPEIVRTGCGFLARGFVCGAAAFDNQEVSLDCARDDGG